MHKKDLIRGLRGYKSEWKGQGSFARFFADYLEKLEIPYDKEYDFWDIVPHLPQIAVDAFEKLRTGKEDWVVSHRKKYESETSSLVPNIIDLGQSNILNQSGAVQVVLGFMLSKIVGEEYNIDSSIDSYCNAQRYVLQQTFDKFIRLVLRNGLFDIIQKSSKRGMDGKFGMTELRTYVIAGRLMFTFARKNRSGSDSSSVSFIAEEADPLALSAGLQSVDGDFGTCLSMIEEVISNWPKTRKGQEIIFKNNKDVKPDVVAVMEAAQRV